MRARLYPFVAVLTFVAALFGCSEERPPINRVQANALDKSIFQDSEWYALQTVVDTPAQSTVTFVGDSSSQLRKIVWDIQEKYLIARDNRQHIDRIEDNPILIDGSAQTGVVAMYEIESHFDVRRDYNQNTGEELNVVVENDQDRPWYEREQFRVDWSKNLVSNEDLGLTSTYGGIDLQPLNYYVQDPEDPLAPHFAQNEEGETYYVDVVNKYFAAPNTTELSSGEVVPSCFLIFGGNTPCQPAEISVRNSFLRADPDADYQPMQYTEERMNRFGYFLTWRDAYSEDYGVTTAQRLRLVNRHNVWKQSHQRDDEGEFIDCASNDDCSGAGSVCDFTFGRAKQRAGACTIPYRERDVRPVPYYLSENFPEDLEPDAQALADGWNSALGDTIDSLRVLECQDAGDADCESERDRKDSNEVFVLCRNPVQKDDPEACGEEGLVARVGDIRYNHIGWVSDVTQGPLGYGPSFADPETGEIISAAAYVYGAAVNTYTAYARDLVALINGDLDEATLTDNDAFAGWIRQMQNNRNLESVTREASRHVAGIDGLDVSGVNDAMSFEWMDELLDRDPSQIKKPASVAEAMDRFESAKTRLIDRVEDLELGDRARARIARIKGTDIEEMMVTDEMRLAAGFGPLENGTSDAVLEKASPLRGQSLDRFREIDALRRQMDGKPNSCVLKADFIDAGLMGLVAEINRAVQQDGVVNWYGIDYEVARDDGAGGRIIDYNQVRQMLRHPIFNALTAHEVGHTLGLRHNFSGSFDSLNYKPEYWQLRNDEHVLPRAWDPETQAEIDGRIREYQYSTVMDYGNNFIVSDAAGIGHYDRAAIKMGYGDLVEVFENAPEENKRLVAQIASLQGFGWPGGIVLLDDADAPLRSVPYTEMPNLIGGIESLQQRADVRYTDLREDPQLFSGVPVYGPGGELVVPYRYCGDEFSDYEPNCLRYDAGADEYEVLTSVGDTYWNYYVFTNFMRQRVSFNPDTVPETIYTRYFAKLESANLNYSLFRGILGDYGATDDFYEAIEGFGAYTAGIGAAYNLLSRVLATPDAGCHSSKENVDGEVALYPVPERCRTGAGNFNIDTFDGRELRTGFSLGPDYSYWFLTRSGYFQDKALALQVMTDPGTRVIGQDTLVDIRRFQVSFYTTFQQPIQQVLRGVIGEDWHPFAARFDGSSLIYPAPDQQVSGELSGTLVSPNLSFALQLYSMVFGMAYLPRTFDYRFIDRGRLFVKGAAESVQLSEDKDLVEFVDESSGLTYQAPSYPDENGKESGVAAQVLRHAQALKDAGSTAELNAWMANVNILRRLTYLMGFGGDDSFL